MEKDVYELIWLIHNASAELKEFIEQDEFIKSVSAETIINLNHTVLMTYHSFRKLAEVYAKKIDIVELAKSVESKKISTL